MLKKMQNGESFFGEKHGKIAHGINFAPKIILVDEVGGQKEPHSLHACKTGARLTDSDLTECN